MICLVCALEVRDHERWCPNCFSDAGFPNVRAARRPEEAAALEARYLSGIAHAERHGTRAIVEGYVSAVEGSMAVICRDYSTVVDLLSSENQLYATFHALVEGQRRRPEPTEFDRDRRAADSILFPYYEREIRFAVLSLDGGGAGFYGPVSMVLSPVAIANRATVFEKNTLEFVRERNLGPGRPVPAGFRSDWTSKHKVAGAKSHTEITATTGTADFPRILLDGDRFIEVHIFGSLHRRSITRIVMQRAARKADLAFQSQIRDMIETDGLAIALETV
ncbi:MAG: hypothetical protein SFV51_18305 [Bryobacteraceae bacterium]|nr:hypothetical protein [Bryobacteraceae bacterium]